MKIGVKLALAQSLLLLALGLAFAMAVSMQLGERLRARSDAVQDRVVEDALGMLDAYNQALKSSVDQYARMFESELIGQFSLDTQRTMPLGQAQVGILRLDNTVLNQRHGALGIQAELANQLGFKHARVLVHAAFQRLVIGVQHAQRVFHHPVLHRVAARAQALAQLHRHRHGKGQAQRQQ
jgi:hypothetical protein